MSKYKNVFAKDYVSNWSEEVSVIKKVKNTVPWTYIIGDLKDEGAAKKKDNKLYVKCKDCDNSFNSWPDKKDII